MEKTIGRLLLKRVNETPKRPAIGWIENHEIKSLNFEDYKKQIELLALGLTKLGFKPGDRLAILSQTNKEWNLTDIATLCLRGSVVPVYPTYTAHDVQLIFNHSDAKFLVIENEQQLEKVASVIGEMPELKCLISFNDISDEGQKKIRNIVELHYFRDVIHYGEELIKTEPDFFHNTIHSQKGDEVASIIYTSGTTGEPKGALITNHAIVKMLENVYSFVNEAIHENDRTLTFLPLSHVLGRTDSLMNLIFGNQNVYAESIDRIIDNISIVSPTVMAAVPRIFEKIYSGIMSKVEHENAIKKQLFNWAVSASEKYFKKIDQDLSPTTLEAVQRKLAYDLVFSKIYARFGGKIRYFVSGGAPLSPEIIKFLRYANLTILEGYGLTETIAPCCLNPLYKQVPGTVGKPIGDVQIKFATDGEIMIKSEAMFKEYYKNPTATQDSFQDGWFLSGDIGEFTSEGFLKITDRKKDIIITSAGKNIAPQKIENMMKTQKYISHFVVIGDGRKFLTAVIGIEKERFLQHFAEFGIETKCTLKELAQHPKILELIQQDIDNVNEQLAQFETIKKFFVSSEEFTTANFLTPSLKIKRKVVAQRFKEEIEAMYQ